VPELVPFRGLRYDHAAVADLSAVICPPYDVISVAERAALAARHPANAVRVELPESYEGAARLFESWQRDGILRRDDRPFVYVYEQLYTLDDGVVRRARGVMCRLRLEPTGSPGSSVRAHEHTMAAPKEDRYRLLGAVRANLSPVALLYSAPAELPADALLDALTDHPADAEATDDAGTRHRLWAIDPTTAPAAAELLARVSVLPLTIADGHHRYETALRFCTEGRAGKGARYVLALLFEAATGGLTILPTHRLVGAAAAGDGLIGRLEAMFVAHALGRSADVQRALRPGTVGVWTCYGGAVLEMRDTGELPVAELDAALSELLGLDRAEMAQQGAVSYTHEAAVAVAAVDSGAAGAAFLLLPPSIDDVLAHAAAGRVMPQKSTYFNPKPATGFVFNTLDS
jgi:uncharacterized protein (DUF1015 family)